jgi:hypothetical protein
MFSLHKNRMHESTRVCRDLLQIAVVDTWYHAHNRLGTTFLNVYHLCSRYYREIPLAIDVVYEKVPCTNHPCRVLA